MNDTTYEPIIASANPPITDHCAPVIEHRGLLRWLFSAAGRQCEQLRHGQHREHRRRDCGCDPEVECHQRQSHEGVRVVIEAEHTCMTLRGVQAVESDTVTSTLLGSLREDARSRQEFFALTGIMP